MNSLLTQAPLLLLAFSMAPAVSAYELPSLLSSLDASASSFRTMTAKLKRIMHTAVINDDSVESGHVRVMRVRNNEIAMLIEFTEPGQKSVFFQGKKAEIYYPNIQTVHEFDLGKHKALVDQFLLLGFGNSSKELSRSYHIKWIGKEAVGAYQSARIELTPKSSQVAEHIKVAELWVQQPDGFPVRQKFVEKSGDYTLIEYSEVKWNPGLTPDQMTLKLPKNVKREFPQK
ncbi:MAG: hypothetical protein JJE04_00480 [Acidobacteriia bacterium]|nr:hypothetical protein [Terriglobia bacterium]